MEEERKKVSLFVVVFVSSSSNVAVVVSYVVLFLQVEKLCMLLDAFFSSGQDQDYLGRVRNVCLVVHLQMTPLRIQDTFTRNRLN